MLMLNIKNPFINDFLALSKSIYMKFTNYHLFFQKKIYIFPKQFQTNRINYLELIENNIKKREKI